MAKIKIEITDFKIEGYELTKVANTNKFMLIFTVGLYDPNDKLITTVNFSSEGMMGHQFEPNMEINNKARDLLVALNELIEENFLKLKGGTG